MASIVNLELDRGEVDPDIFKAAKEDNVDELYASLSCGQTLNSRHSSLLGMTPIHLACVFGSNAFLQAAVAHGNFDPWLRDANERVAFDHAAAKNNRPAMEMLYGLMYPSGWAKHLTPE